VQRPSLARRAVGVLVTVRCVLFIFHERRARPPWFVLALAIVRLPVPQQFGY
jgi:hypothetical protein